MNILLDYAFKVSSITPTPQASTAFLKQVCLVVKPKEGVDVVVPTLCTSTSAVAALTDNIDATRLFAAGMSRVYILPSDDLDLETALTGSGSLFYTLLISSDFSDAEIRGAGDIVASPEVKASLKVQDILYTAKLTGTAGNAITIEYEDDLAKDDGSATVSVTSNTIVVDIETGVTTAATIKAAIEASSPAHALVGAVIDFGDSARSQAIFAEANLAGGTNEVTASASEAMDIGTFSGVIGLQSQDTDIAAEYAAVEKRSGWYANSTNKARNMCFAFGSLLSNALAWRNQQYITMPLSDGVDELGEAEAFFDDKVSFVITDDEFANRLALFAAGGKAIVAPYVKRNLEINLQSRALSFISGNQPAYTAKNATLLENELKDVIQLFIDRGEIAAGTVEVKLEQENFVASGYINIAEPKALWRVFAEMRQTL